MRTLLIAALAAALLSAPPPAAAQSTAPPSAAEIAALAAEADTLRADAISMRGFGRAQETQATKVVERARRLVAALQALPSADTTATAPPVVTPPPDSSVPTPPVVVVPRPADPALPSSSVTLPRRTVDVTMPAISGRVLTVGASLQSALDSARSGDLVVLEPGKTYTGAFTLRTCHAGGVVVTAQGFAVPAGQRARPADSTQMARLASPGSNQPTLRIPPGACGWRLVGLHATAAPGAAVGTLVSIAGHDARGTDDEPTRITLDRMLIRGREDQSLQRCVALNGAHLAVIDSWLDECHAKGADSQAIGGWQGSGPFLIQNNYLAGAGENVMFGGADSRSVELLPSDITIRWNHFTKPAAWQDVWTVKNLLELKVGRRVLVEGNVFTNNWAGGQNGFAVVLKSTNQSGTAPWSETSDVTFRLNVVRNVAQGITLAGRPESSPAVPASRFDISHNLFEQIGSGDYPGGRLFQLSGVDRVTITRNTAQSTHTALLLTGGTDSALVVTDNQFSRSAYWIHGDGKGSGADGLNARAPGWVFRGNVLPGASPKSYPAGNDYPASDAALALLDLTGRGADVAAVLARTAGVLVHP